MYCPNCGKQIQDNIKFCTECGAKIAKETLNQSGKESVQTNQKSENSSNDYKPIITFLGVFAFIFCILVGVFKNFDSKNPVLTAKATDVKEKIQKELPPVIDPIDVEYLGCHIQYLGFEIKNSSSPRILIYYMFENNDVEDRHHQFDLVVREYAYQDGILLDSTYDSNAAGRDSNTIIRPGGKLTVCSSFILRNTTSPVELKMEEDILFFSEVLGEMTIPITNKQ